MKKFEIDFESQLIYFDGELLPFAMVTSTDLGNDQYYGSGYYLGEIKNKLKPAAVDPNDFSPRVHLVIDDLPKDLDKYLILDTNCFSVDIIEDLKFMQGIDVEQEMNSYCRMTNFRFPQTEEGEYAKQQFKLYYKYLLSKYELENIKKDFE